MTTTPHRDCDHPATKAARAKCRKARAAAEASQATSLTDLIASYYAGADLEEIAAQAPSDIARGYYDNSLDAEEFIAALREGAAPAPADDPAPEGMMTLTANDSSIEVAYDDLVFLTRTPHPGNVYPGEMGKAMIRRQTLIRTLTAALGIDAKELIRLVKALVWSMQ